VEITGIPDYHEGIVHLTTHDDRVTRSYDVPTMTGVVLALAVIGVVVLERLGRGQRQDSPPAASAADPPR
jgi:hypothetical protein